MSTSDVPFWVDMEPLHISLSTFTNKMACLGCFSNFGGQPAFGGGYGVGAEYSTWDRKAAHYDDYYQTGRTADHQTAYASSAPSTGRQEESSSSPGVKQVEQVMQGLSLETAKPVQQELQQQQSQQPKKLTWTLIASQPSHN
jgi:hypothetical protein